MEKYNVTVNNKKYHIEIEDTNDINSIKKVLLNGKEVNIDVNMDTMCSIVVDNNTHKINGVYDFDGELVKLLIGKDYHTIEVGEDRPIKVKEPRHSKKKKEGSIKAPMPGKITSIEVKVGDAVTEGQDLMALEAMKMENKIKAPKSGTMKNIHTSIGATCNSGDLLMVIE
jgi:biotin carboxyl carrier protein